MRSRVMTLALLLGLAACSSPGVVTETVTAPPPAGSPSGPAPGQTQPLPAPAPPATQPDRPPDPTPPHEFNVAYRPVPVRPLTAAWQYDFSPHLPADWPPDSAYVGSMGPTSILWPDGDGTAIADTLVYRLTGGWGEAGVTTAAVVIGLDAATGAELWVNVYEVGDTTTPFSCLTETIVGGLVCSAGTWEPDTPSSIIIINPDTGAVTLAIDTPFPASMLASSGAWVFGATYFPGEYRLFAVNLERREVVWQTSAPYQESGEIPGDGWGSLQYYAGTVQLASPELAAVFDAQTGTLLTDFSGLLGSFDVTGTFLSWDYRVDNQYVVSPTGQFVTIPEQAVTPWAWHWTGPEQPPVFAVNYDDRRPRIYAYDRTTGRQLWELPDFHNLTALTNSCAIVYSAEHVACLDPFSGHVRWQQPITDDEQPNYGAFKITPTQLVGTSYGTEDPQIVAIDLYTGEMAVMYTSVAGALSSVAGDDFTITTVFTGDFQVVKLQ